VNDRSCKLVWGMRYEEDVFWQDDFKALEKKYKNFKFDLVLSRDGEKLRVTDVLREIKLVKETEFYICGSNAMVDDCQKILVDKGVGEDKIYFEKYG
jgi:Na+-transporting NADH:ubiquinone oxidoreductase subunit F